MKLFYKFLLVLVGGAVFNAQAQMPHDAIYMNKKSICIATTYSNSQWSEYWENKLKRENFNIGTHTTQSVMPMIAYGITKKLNVLAGLPYVWTKTSAGNLMGQQGFQDVSVWLKYNMVQSANGLSLHGVLGGSLPVSNYVPDFLPMSIGLKSKTATARLIAHYKHTSGFYITAHGSYVFRSNIKVDRDAYYAYDKVYNTNEISMPNATDVAARMGYYKKGIQAELFIDKNTCVGGDYIRRNDMPFPTNNMKSSGVGFYGKFQPKNVGFNVMIRRVIDGENMGQATTISAGFLYQINFKSKSEQVTKK
ncbi:MULTISPECIES: hypothetical protein [Emticicia]|uniref:hypothetical protein n=1 Tax=Emticicia TaxID=312278 RepID=UPI0020A12710|nr:MULTISPECIES: hypothetical protein [Emticicia]UTA69292.1 hypothetical protein MB380_05675 [Emticicia sp. 21SJ11W-3]